MKVREKKDPSDVFHSSQFNTHAIGEVIGYAKDGSAGLFFIRELDVQLSSGEWKDMRRAFEDHDLITNNYNTRFFEPGTEEDRKRGYTLF